MKKKSKTKNNQASKHLGYCSYLLNGNCQKNKHPKRKHHWKFKQILSETKKLLNVHAQDNRKIAHIFFVRLYCSEPVLTLTRIFLPPKLSENCFAKFATNCAWPLIPADPLCKQYFRFFDLISTEKVQVHAICFLFTALFYVHSCSWKPAKKTLAFWRSANNQIVCQRKANNETAWKKNDGNQGCSVLAQCHLFFSKDNRKPGHVSC